MACASIDWWFFDSVESLLGETIKNKSTDYITKQHTFTKLLFEENKAKKKRFAAKISPRVSAIWFEGLKKYRNSFVMLRWPKQRKRKQVRVVAEIINELTQYAIHLISLSLLWISNANFKKSPNYNNNNNDLKKLPKDIYGDGV